ncbi:MAG: hypothetical protein KC583_00470, partial [Myxococcales bacterium]|nr:hypothetical protein [Myxococcales bacterium]
PAGADVDGDGRVAVSIDFDLDYHLRQDFDLLWNVGGGAALGESKMRLTLEQDRENPQRLTNTYGPQAYAELTIQIEENCPVTTRPTFPTARRQGALDLRAP